MTHGNSDTIFALRFDHKNLNFFPVLVIMETTGNIFIVTCELYCKIVAQSY